MASAASIVYVLRLQSGKFFVGKTTGNLETEMAQHKKGEGGAWTQLHPPICVYRVVENGTSSKKHLEDDITREFMLMHGPQNVRGGRYVDVKLSMTQQEELEQELKNSMESCYACGAAGHYMSECPELNGESVLTDSSMECL